MAPQTITTSTGDFAVAPLTLRQVETLNTKEMSLTSIIFIAMQNAGFQGTEDSLKDSLSFKSLGELRDAVYEMTGLKVATPGEVTAAETSGTSSTAA